MVRFLRSKQSGASEVCKLKYIHFNQRMQIQYREGNRHRPRDHIIKLSAVNYKNIEHYKNNNLLTGI